MNKPRTQDVSPNKLSESQKKQIEHVRDRLQHQGLGRAEKQAIREVVESTDSGQGGGTNAAGESKKGSEHRGPTQRKSSHG